MLRAILLDVGGPLFDEDEALRASDRELVQRLNARGRRVSPEQIAAARLKAVESYAPSYLRATIWALVKPDLDLYEELALAIAHVFDRESRRVRPEAFSVLNVLVRRYKLALAANQPVENREFLREQGLLSFFTLDLVPGELGFAKPDPRFFLTILEKLKVRPEQAVMVGDRLDNDIYPAKRLGLKTVQITVGPHAHQEPRTPLDMPAVAIASLQELPQAIETLR
jgi:HAD superfamily hydrolase (TIGR01549 family)